MSSFPGTPGAYPGQQQQGPRIESLLGQFSESAINELRFFIQSAVRGEPVTQLGGFYLYGPQFATPVDDIESTASESWVNLATDGPIITGLPDGEYGFLWGAAIGTTNDTVGTTGYVGVRVNTTDPTDAEAASGVTGGLDTSDGVAKGIVKRLSNSGNNTVKLRYRNADDAESSYFGDRWLIAVRRTN